MIDELRFWFYGAQKGWETGVTIPPWAWTSHDPITLAYYRGHTFGSTIKRMFKH